MIMTLVVAELDNETNVQAMVFSALACIGISLTSWMLSRFSTLPTSAKLRLTVAMLMGRLEYLVMFVIFIPRFWLW